MRDPIFMDNCDILDCFEEELAAALGDDYHHSLSSESNSSSNTLLNIPNSSSTTNLLCASSTLEALESPNSAKHHKPNTWSTNNNDNNNNNIATASLDLQPPVFSSGFILSFGNSSSTENPIIPPRTLNSEDKEVVAGILLSHQGSFVLNNKEGNKSSQGAKKSGNSNPRRASQTYDHIIAERKRREQLSQLFVALSAIVPGLKKVRSLL
ncbi:hypothetical protein Vadar_028205 [Vaccinium darrowii]|uniref:Uncharacterized protein n=1 Tax=Vaccinium darrowii TaxID=229202 RepID=A0ACB7YGR7_9ERIC|nr:hypothetical protein Vadar_028205 [Vaccinium darrowii]